MKHIFIMKDTKKHHDFEKIIREVMVSYDYEVIYTTSMQACLQHIQRYSQKARFYAVGGDGTIHGMIQALIHTDHELVVIPYGTGNDFCRMLTRMKDPRQILEQSLHRQAQKIDTIQLNDMYFINAACFGLDNVVASHVHDVIKIPFIPESKSYIVSIIQNIFRYKNVDVKMMSEGTCLYQGKVILCTVNNGTYYGGGFPIVPHALIQDGKMDICVVDSLPMIKIPYMLFLLLRRQLHKRKEVHYFQVKEVDVICRKSCNVDGEEMWFNDYHFQIHPASLNIVIFD